MTVLRRLASRLLPPPVKAALRRAFPGLIAGRPGLRRLSRRRIAPAMTAHSYDVIVFPIIDWFFLFQRPQQLALQFARNGHRVFYLDQANLRDGPWARPGVEPEATWIEENVALASRLASRPLDPYTDVLDDAQVQEIVRSLDVLRRRFAIATAVCLVQLPFWTPLALRLRREWGWKVVYDCMDEHAGFLTNTEQMLAFEDQLIREADLVVVTSQYLQEKVCPHSRRCLRVPNAADFDHFQRARTPLRADRALERLSPPIIGYYGCISSWFDMELIQHAARARPGWNFVLIGSAFGIDERSASRLPNVHFLGPKPYEGLPAYLSRFDVCCIPFKISPLTIASNPVKFFEYISAGKPVVATLLPELRPYAQHVYLAEGPEPFLRAIEQALSESDVARAEERIALARANTWEERYRQLDQPLLSLFSPHPAPHLADQDSSFSPGELG